MATGQYIRIYHLLKDEYPGVWASDAQLAGFIRLLLIADKWWPQWAPKPFGRPTSGYLSLQKAGLVVESPDGSGFSIAGLDKERQTRSEHGKRAASIRWSNAPSNAGAMPSKARAEHSNGVGNAQTPAATFMGFRPTAAHMGQHPDCLVCAPLRESEGTP